jgi:hypothetical protein
MHFPYLGTHLLKCSSYVIIDTPVKLSHDAAMMCPSRASPASLADEPKETDGNCPSKRPDMIGRTPEPPTPAEHGAARIFSNGHGRDDHYQVYMVWNNLNLPTEPYILGGEYICAEIGPPQ